LRSERKLGPPGPPRGKKEGGQRTEERGTGRLPRLGGEIKSTSAETKGGKWAKDDMGTKKGVGKREPQLRVR